MVEGSNLNRILIGLSALFVLGGVALFATAPDPDRVPTSGEGAAELAVRTHVVAVAQQRDRVVLSGVLEPRRSVRLFSETNGRVLEAGAEALDRVEAEQLLVQVDPLRAKIAVERADAALARSQSERALARASLSRQQNLAERDVASASALDDAENRARVAEAVIREARASLEEARDELAKKTIRAPFAGVLRSFDVEQGEYLRAGQALGEALDLSTARITIGLADRQIVLVAAGQRVDVEVEALANERFSGVILRVASAADAASKKFPVEIEVDNAEGRLLPGMIGRVGFDLEGDGPRLRIPRQAVGEEFGLRFVYVLAQDGEGRTVAGRRRVVLRELPFEPALVEVLSGLGAGEEIAVSGVNVLSDGLAVRRTGRVDAAAGLAHRADPPTP